MDRQKVQHNITQLTIPHKQQENQPQQQQQQHNQQHPAQEDRGVSDNGLSEVLSEVKLGVRWRRKALGGGGWEKVVDYTRRELAKEPEKKNLRRKALGGGGWEKVVDYSRRELAKEPEKKNKQEGHSWDKLLGAIKRREKGLTITVSDLGSDK